MLVLTYHSISPGPSPLCISAERLAEQLDALAALGWQAVPLRVLEELVASAPKAFASMGGRQRIFAITFDDGYRDFHDAALPILEARGLPATLFALPGVDPAIQGGAGVPGGTGAPALSIEALRAVTERGVEIGAHSLSHRDLTRLDDASLARELEGSRQHLEDATGARVERLAYPFGRFDRRVRGAASDCFRAAFTTQFAAVDASTDPLAIPRVDAFYLDSPSLRRALAAGRPGRYLTPRRWLRRLRGSEPRRAVPRRPSPIHHRPSHHVSGERSSSAHVSR